MTRVSIFAIAALIPAALSPGPAEGRERILTSSMETPSPGASSLVVSGERRGSAASIASSAILD